MSGHLKANSLSFFESLVMGVAGSAPGYTIAVTTAVLIATVGHLSPGALIIFSVPMLGIAVAYRALSKNDVNAGAAYSWTTAVCGRFWGYFSGWALLIASMVFMVTGSIPIATATLNFFNPALAGNVVITAAVASGWFLLIALVLIVGIEITSKLQIVMTTIELVILVAVLIAAVVHASSSGVSNPFSWSWFGLGYTPDGFAASALVVVFFYWGWDVTSNLGEETAGGGDSAGTGGFLSIFITILFYIGFTIAALLLFSTRDAADLTDNIIYNMAVASGLGHTGGLLASLAVILSSIATLETTMLQFSRTLFAMGRDGALPRRFGEVEASTQNSGACDVYSHSRGIGAYLGVGNDAKCECDHIKFRQCGRHPGRLLLWSDWSHRGLAVPDELSGIIRPMAGAVRVSRAKRVNAHCARPLRNHNV